MKARYLIVAIAAMALVGGAAVFGLPDLSPAPDRMDGEHPSTPSRRTRPTCCARPGSPSTPR